MLKINVGCGYKKIEGFVNIDIDPRHEPDMVLDLSENRLGFDDSSVDVIYCSHVLEHLVAWEDLMLEFHRVLKPGGYLEIRVPVYPSLTALSGIGHVRFFTPVSFAYFLDPRYGQPKGYACDYMGLFYEDREKRVVKLSPGLECKDDDERAIFGMPVDVEMRVYLRKATKEYWVSKGVTKNLPTDVYACFFCKKPFNGHYTCCGVEYTFADGVTPKSPLLRDTGG